MGGLGADAAEQGVDDPGGEGVGVLVGRATTGGAVSGRAASTAAMSSIVAAEFWPRVRSAASRIVCTVGSASARSGRP